MSLRDVVDALARSATVRDHTIRLPDPEAAQDGELPEEGYFSVRLSEMRLTDERRWLHDITPAVFVIGEYDYNGERVRKPCFVSNRLLGDLGHRIDAGKLRVNFANKLVLGPTPYAGGDVELFVGLFQTATEERLTAMFGVFETLFGKIGGPVTAGIALVREVLPAMLKCLGAGDVRCLLADYRPIGEQSLPTDFYLAYLRGERGRAVDTASLQVRDRQLVRLDGPTADAVDDVDYCLIRVQCTATRGDYRSLPFHPLWLKAMELTGAQRHQDAQAFMLECSSQILASPDLTESHKIGLLEEYQARILAARAAMNRTFGAPERGSTALSARGMRERVRSSGEFNGQGMVDRIDDIARRSVAIGSDELDDEALDRLLAAAPRGKSARDTAALVRTLALGSIAL